MELVKNKLSTTILKTSKYSQLRSMMILMYRMQKMIWNGSLQVQEMSF